MDEYKAILLEERLAKIDAGVTTDAERELFLNWLQNTHGYHAMLRGKYRFESIGFGDHRGDYTASLRSDLEEMKAKIAAQGEPFDGMPLYGPRPTAA